MRPWLKCYNLDGWEECGLPVLRSALCPPPSCSPRVATFEGLEDVAVRVVVVVVVVVVAVVVAVLTNQSIPISSASSKFLADVGIIPCLPTPTGIWSNTACASLSFRPLSMSFSLRLVRRSLCDVS